MTTVVIKALPKGKKVSEKQGDLPDVRAIMDGLLKSFRPKVDEDEDEEAEDKDADDVGGLDSLVRLLEPPVGATLGKKKPVVTVVEDTTMAVPVGGAVPVVEAAPAPAGETMVPLSEVLALLRDLYASAPAGVDVPPVRLSR